MVHCEDNYSSQLCQVAQGTLVILFCLPTDLHLIHQNVENIVFVWTFCGGRLSPVLLPFSAGRQKPLIKSDRHFQWSSFLNSSLFSVRGGIISGYFISPFMESVRTGRNIKLHSSQRDRSVYLTKLIDYAEFTPIQGHWIVLLLMKWYCLLRILTFLAFCFSIAVRSCFNVI